MATRRTRRQAGRGKGGGVWVVLRVLLVGLLLIETCWLAAFIYATGSPVPPGLSRALPGRAGGDTPWDEARERELREKEEDLDSLRVRKMLSQHGSRGGTDALPEP